MIDHDKIIEHYGKKGMRWGVRNRRSGSSKTTGSRTTYSKPPIRLSDTELKKRISRMEMEKRYVDLNTNTQGKGKKIVEEILTNAGKTVATSLLVGGGLALAKKSSRLLLKSR